MATKPPTQAERLYMLLADALWSAEGTDSAATVRNRVMEGTNDSLRAEVEALIRGRRLLYTQTSTEDAESA